MGGGLPAVFPPDAVAGAAGHCPMHKVFRVLRQIHHFHKTGGIVFPEHRGAQLNAGLTCRTCRDIDGRNLVYRLISFFPLQVPTVGEMGAEFTLQVFVPTGPAKAASAWATCLALEAVGASLPGSTFRNDRFHVSTGEEPRLLPPPVRYRRRALPHRARSES